MMLPLEYGAVSRIFTKKMCRQDDDVVRRIRTAPTDDDLFASVALFV
jgi:hypothetical protein